MAYLRRTGTDYEELSIVVSESEYNLLVEAIEDPTRNTLGHVCNLARVLRDHFDVNIGSGYEDSV
jgi:hypothetical protein